MADEQHTKTYYLKDSDRAPAEERESPAVSPEAAPDPTPEPAAAKPSPSSRPSPPSQVEMDIKEAGLTPEEATRASHAMAAENERKTGRGGAENLAVVSRFRWLFLLILSLAATLTWTIEAQYAGRPYHWPAWGLLLVAVLVTVPAARFLRLPTRAGLAALFWSATFFVSALYGPQDTIFNRIPAALPWAGLLTLVIFFTAVAVWRKVGRYKVIDLVLAVVLIYAALSPLWSLIDNLAAGGALALKFDILSASPAFLTERLPWYLWPMTIMVLGILPLAALFALWDQCSALKRKGGRHGGNFFLALAFLGLMPYGFLAFDQAVAAKPAWTQALRAILPSASAHAREGGVEWSAPNGGAPVPSELSEPPESAPEEQPPAEEAAPVTPEAVSVPDKMTEAEPAPAPAESAAPPQTSAPPLPPAMVEPEAPPLTEADPAPEAAPPVGSDSMSILTFNARLRATEQELAAAMDRIKELERKLDQLTSTPVPAPAPPSSPAPGPKPEATPPAERPWPEVTPEPVPNPPHSDDGSPYSSTSVGRPIPPDPGLAT